MADKTYRFSIVGCGRWGKNMIKTINGLPNMEVAAICTSNPANAKLIPHKVQVYSDFHDMIFGMPGIDGVIICCPPQYQPKVIDDCIAALKPFIAEKPFALSSKQALAMITDIQRAKLPCIVDYTQLFNPAYRELAGRNFKNKTKSILSKTHSFGPFRKDVSMVWDWLPHDLSMIVASTPDSPLSVTASYDVEPNYDNAGQINVELSFKNFKANIEIDNVAGKKYRVFEIENSFSKLCMMDNELFEIKDSIRPITVSNQSPLQELIKAFILYIESGESFGLEISSEVTRIIEKTIEAIETGEKVAI